VADAIRFVSSGVSAPGINYVHADHLGAPQKMTDANQALVWDAVYTPFGQVHSITGTATNNQRFPGQYADAETGFNYNYFRDYDPTTGRYVQSDPIGLDGGLNTYAYVGGNPIIRADETGELWQAPALFCARFPRICKEIFKCIQNPTSCQKKFCNKRRLNTVYKGLCNVPGCMDADGPAAASFKLGAAQGCLWLRQSVTTLCHGGKSDAGHTAKMNEARNKIADCGCRFPSLGGS